MQRRCIYKTGHICFVCLILAGSVFFPARQPLQAKEAPLPFQTGEQLHYFVRWESVPAGEAVFTVLEPGRINGQGALHFLLEISSNKFVDMLFKIQDRLEGFCDEALTRSLRYSKKQSGKEKKEISVVFDWDTQTVVYSNNGGKRDPLGIPAGTFDPLSAFYKMRTLDFESGDTVAFPITDGKKQFVQEVLVRGRETLCLDSGQYHTILLTPEVKHFSGVFKRSTDPSVRVWITADERKIPVRIKVKVFVGSVVFDLVEVRSNPAH